MKQNTFKQTSFRRLGLSKITIFFSLFFLYSCNMMDGEIYYIPEGLSGDIVVLFEREDGLPGEWKDGKRLYRIPPSGVLKTQFKTNTGSVFLKSTENEEERTNEKYRTFNEKFEFYYVDENNNPIKKLNYPIYTSDREFIKPNDYNVFGRQTISSFGFYNTSFLATEKKIIFCKNTMDIDSKDKSLEKFYKIHYWDTFDVRKDSVPSDFDWDEYRKLEK